MKKYSSSGNLDTYLTFTANGVADRFGFLQESACDFG
jgi:hypothetical protein